MRMFRTRQNLVGRFDTTVSSQVTEIREKHQQMFTNTVIWPAQKPTSAVRTFGYNILKERNHLDTHNDTR